MSVNTNNKKCPHNRVRKNGLSATLHRLRFKQKALSTTLIAFRVWMNALTNYPLI